MVINT
ncbi:hypothetical protein FOXB_16780 [Fusarium oxysporum f. sp. conglutinans Fo5176]